VWVADVSGLSSDHAQASCWRERPQRLSPLPPRAVMVPINLPTTSISPSPPVKHTAPASRHHPNQSVAHPNDIHIVNGTTEADAAGARPPHHIRSDRNSSTPMAIPAHVKHGATIAYAGACPTAAGRRES
jgi:hypothetical protein